MFSYIYDLLKKIINYPGFIEKKISQLEHRMFIYFLIVVHIEVIGFILVYAYLEKGFHWKYLFQV